MEVGEENRKSRKREVLDFVPPPLHRQRTLLSPIFAFRPRFGRQSGRVAGNSLLIFREIRIKLPGQAESIRARRVRVPPLRPRQHFKLAFHWLVRRNFIYPPRRQKQPRFPSLKPRHGATTVRHQNEIPMPARFEREGKVSGERSWTSRTSYGLGSIVFSLLVADHLFKFPRRILMISSFLFYWQMRLDGTGKRYKDMLLIERRKSSSMSLSFCILRWEAIWIERDCFLWFLMAKCC